MASRSFKPASYLASAAQQAPNRSPRPSFTRTSSNSSTTSDDSVLATLRGLRVVDNEGITSAATNNGHNNTASKLSFTVHPRVTFCLCPHFSKQCGVQHQRERRYTNPLPRRHIRQLMFWYGDRLGLWDHDEWWTDGSFHGMGMWELAMGKNCRTEC